MSDDLIKKEEAKEAVCKGCLKDWKICHHNWDCPMLMNLEMLPSADVAPVKHGRWIRKDSKRYYWYECSNCGYPPPLDRYKHEWFSEYCPNCGAKMDEVEE